MKIVGLVAPKTGGKDTTYDLLKELKKANGKISFAGPLKEIISQVFKISPVILNDPIHKETPFKEPITLTSRHFREVKNICVSVLDPIEGTKILYNPNKASISGLEGRLIKSPRELMQVIGTDFIRDRLYGEWHMRAALSSKRLAKLSPAHGTFCITDVRFLNEHEFLKDKFKDAYTCYYVERPEAEAMLATATHASELEVKKIRAVLTESSIIKNDGSLEDLKGKLSELALPEPKKPEKGSRFRFTAKK